MPPRTIPKKDTHKTDPTKPVEESKPQTVTVEKIETIEKIETTQPNTLIQVIQVPFDPIKVFAEAKLAEEGATGITRDLPKCVTLYEKLVENDSIEAMVRLAGIYMNGVPRDETDQGIEKNPDRAAELYIKASDKDSTNISVLKTCAALYQYGIGVYQDSAKAIQYYEKAVTLNDVQSMNNLGTILMSGGSFRDLTKAIQLFTKAIEMGNANACTNLGAIYLFGMEEVQVDLVKARELLEIGVKRNDVESFTNLALLNEREKNDKKAFEYFQLGMDKGSQTSKAYLAIRYFQGNGVDKDLIRAIEMLQEASGAGNGVASAFIERYEEIEPIGALKARELSTRFFDAIDRKDFDKLKVTLEKGVNIDAYLDGEHSLSVCVNLDRLEFFKYLISKGANVNAKSKNDFQNPLSLNIITKKRPEYLSYLLSLPREFEYNVNLSSNQNVSPLICAVLMDQREIVRILIEDARINPGITHKGKTAYDFAKENKDIFKVYLDSFVKHYKKSVSSGDKIILFNERTQTYIGVPELTPDGWEIGKLQVKGKELIISSANGGKISNGDRIRLQTTEIHHAGFNYLYSSTSGWVYHDQKADDNPKQFWKLIKLNILRDNLVDLEKELYYGDIIKIENCYYPTANLYECKESLATSYYNADKWFVLK